MAALRQTLQAGAARPPLAMATSSKAAGAPAATSKSGGAPAAIGAPVTRQFFSGAGTAQRPPPPSFSSKASGGAASFPFRDIRLAQQADDLDASPPPDDLTGATTTTTQWARLTHESRNVVRVGSRSECVVVLRRVRQRGTTMNPWYLAEGRGRRYRPLAPHRHDWTGLHGVFGATGQHGRPCKHDSRCHPSD